MSFKVDCPYCEEENDFGYDNWHDELIDDSCEHDIDCLFCGKTMSITVHAKYTLSAEKSEEI